MFLKTKLQLLQVVTSLTLANAWQQWDYSDFPSDDWRDIWGFGNGPGGRRGHSMVVWNDAKSSSSKVILFGGRDNEIHRPHLPKTYDLIEEDGMLEFTTYDERPVLPEFDSNACQPEKTCVPLENASSGNNETCSYSWEDYLVDGLTPIQRERMEQVCGFVATGLDYNDVWVYDLNCDRYAELPCVDDGWRVLHPGVRFGGCRTEDGKRICITPSERWGHDAVMIDDTTMIVYGGFSQECEDYCNDLWAFDLEKVEWQRLVVSSHSNPGKRWKFSMVSATDASGEENNRIILFAGHRLWHGFSADNSEDNQWQDTDVYPKGGYLDDLWILSRRTEETTTNADDGRGNGSINVIWSWEEQTPKDSFTSSPGGTWESRDNVKRDVYWPPARSGHTATFDGVRNGMWVHGGYSTFFPYPSSTSRGSANGVKAQTRVGFVPYSSYLFYLDDIWFYDITNGHWKQLKPAQRQIPEKRTDHLMISTGDILVLYGGYSYNQYFNDTWYYYPDENRWLEKTEFLRKNSEGCTGDLETAKNESKCMDPMWVYPPARSDHRGVYVEKYSMIFFYGGVGMKFNGTEEGHFPTPSIQNTFETEVLNDLWTYHLHTCPQNCSDHGVCSNAFCHCDPGYYGIDCRHSTCPGSVCLYDDDYVQRCVHCCYDGYTHHIDDDEEMYLPGVRKTPCRPKSLEDGIFTGSSNGICDGHGECQCALPFLGDDCSMKDCKHNCSFNGHCSVEFPISRCICNDGYYGEYCQHIECLNNCSYPNGICDHDAGLCQCNPIYSPYNKSQIWSYFAGDDCSYVSPWCGCPSKQINLGLLLVIALVVSIAIQVLY